jgi:hypothetical protein
MAWAHLEVDCSDPSKHKGLHRCWRDIAITVIDAGRECN